MATQYTPILQLALPVTGELNGTWGDVVNDNITSMVEQAIAGLATISTWTANSHTLTTADGTTDEARCAMLVAQTGAGGTALTAAGEIICPARTKLYVLSNTSAYTVTLKTAAGSGVAVPAGDTTFLFCDGTNVNACVTTIVNGHISGNLTVDGNTTLGNATTDTITATARVASDLNPSADNTYDLGTVGNSWRNLYVDGIATIATLNVTTIDTTNLEVTNIKAKDGTAAITLADSTGVATFSATPVLNAGTINQVQFLNASKQLVGDADFTFDGTTLSVAGLTLTNSPTLNGGTANQVQFLNASKVLSGDADLTFDGTTLTAANFTSGGTVTLSGGTANGVAYLNGSKVLTTGSALTFDGNNLTQNGANAAVSLQVNTTNVGVSAANYSEIQLADSGAVRSYWRNLRDGSGATIFSGNDHIRYALFGSEQMRLTSTGLGIGTSSPGSKLEVNGRILQSVNSASIYQGLLLNNFDAGGSGNRIDFSQGTSNVIGSIKSYYSSGWKLSLGATSTGDSAIFDSSGNLGLGVTPSAWGVIQGGAFQTSGAGAIWSTGVSDVFLSQNTFFNGNYRYIGTYAASAYRQLAGAHAWYTAPSGTAGNAISFTQAMTLDASGNLGIGTSSPADKLEVAGAIRVSGSGSASGDNAQFYNASGFGPTINGYNFAIRTGASTTSERMRIDSDGNVLVGTTSVAGNGLSLYATAGSIQTIFNSAQTSFTANSFRYNGTQVGSISTSTTATSYVTSSDYRLKENIQPMQNALAVVQQLKPVTYTWKTDGSDGQGFIAHELQAVVPDCVTGEKDAVDKDGKPVYQGIDTSFLVATLTKAIQEQQEQINQLTARVAQLEGN